QPAVSLTEAGSHPPTPTRPAMFLPSGRSYVKLATKTFGISPVERSRSSFRLKLSATGKLAIGPVRIDASNTDEASSINFDLVYDTRKESPLVNRCSSLA